MSARPIDINDAIAYATKWQNENPKHAKAHLIPNEDLIACLEEMGVLVSDGEGKYTLNVAAGAGVRAYMGINRPEGEAPSPQTEKLLLVGTKLDCEGIPRDLVQGEKPSGCEDKAVDNAVKALAGSGVYDFTKPCPNLCDINSPLNP
ncbi:hypothetical protein [Lacinutrix jangbogonensis]|uniref:hypothetical protein n=1 Tax=Lacinutrix jangbogonensis TaxID=1469557 RepID=UPI00053D192F|nr:hypothetical protein [Lacinutrix jangbogonensis]